MFENVVIKFRLIVFTALLGFLITGCSINRQIKQDTFVLIETEVEDEIIFSADSITPNILPSSEPSGMRSFGEKEIPQDEFTNEEKIIPQKSWTKKINEVKQTPKDKIISSDVVDEEKVNKPRMNAMALLGFIFVLMGIIPFLGQIAGFVMCIIALNQMKKNPGMYSGKGLATAGFILFLLYVVVAIVVALFYYGLLSFNGGQI